MKKEISDITGFVKVTAKNGRVLTFYQDGLPIDEYVGFKTVHVKNELDLEGLREITKSEHDAYRAAHDSYIANLNSEVE